MCLHLTKPSVRAEPVLRPSDEPDAPDSMAASGERPSGPSIGATREPAVITPTVVETAVDLKEISEEMENEFSRVPPLKISRINKIDRQPEEVSDVEIDE